MPETIIEINGCIVIFFGWFLLYIALETSPFKLAAPVLLIFGSLMICFGALLVF
jgi:hypothetical protein